MELQCTLLNYYIFTDKIRNNGYLVKVINYFYNFLYHSYQILLIGPKMPKPLHSHSSVQFGDGLLVIGGISNWDSQSAIYYFGCKAAICSWTTMDQKLSEPR